jgi:hypothetical protein
MKAKAHIVVCGMLRFAFADKGEALRFARSWRSAGIDGGFAAYAGRLENRSDYVYVGSRRCSGAKAYGLNRFYYSNRSKGVSK